MVRTAEAMPLNVGHIVSGGAHALLIGWLLVGGVFQSDPKTFEISGVEMISLADFDALFPPENTPTPETAVQTPVAPEAIEPAPTLTPQAADPVPETVAVPEPVETVPDLVPEVAQPAPPPPVIIETPEPPALPSPEPPSTAPDVALRPSARPVTRVAPTPVEAPSPDLQIAEIDQAPTQPSEDPAPALEEAKEATAQQEAVTEIPTEPENKAAAPTASLRPRIRPTRTTSVTQPAVEPATDPVPTNSDALNAALAQALEDPQDQAPARPSGPPLTAGEKDDLRIAVQNCWNVDVGSQSANVVVTLGLSLDRDGKVLGNSLRLLGAEGGDERAIQAAFDAARRAVLRCQRSGYKLPIEKYEHWRDIEMTFNPEKMRRR